MDPNDFRTVKLVFGVIGNIIGVGVNLSPMPTFWKIHKCNSTKKFSALPYVFSLFSALLWVLYSLPMVTENAAMLISINSASSAIQIFYLTVFLTYAAKEGRIHTIKVLAAFFAFMATTTVLTLTVVPRVQRSQVVGCLCVVIGAMTYASPLSIARMVILTRSVEFLPILLCLCFLINSSVWTCYGMFTKDIFVLIPNGLGVVFGVAQIALYLLYRNAKPLDESSKTGKVGDATVTEISIDKIGDACVLELPKGKAGGAPAMQLPTLSKLQLLSRWEAREEWWESRSPLSSNTRLW